MRRKPRRHAPRLGSSARHKSLAGPTQIPDGPKKKAYHGSMQVVGLALSWQFHCVKAARWSKRPCRVGSWGLRHHLFLGRLRCAHSGELPFFKGGLAAKTARESWPELGSSEVISWLL